MKHTLAAVGLAVVCLAWAVPTRALLLCQKRSGAVFVRAACKKKETPLSFMPGGGSIVGTCPPDSELVGTTCVDTYEASVWQIDPSNISLLTKVKDGTAKVDDLTAAGAVQLGASVTCNGPADYGAHFPASGQWTQVPGSSPPSPGLYALSIPGVQPSACITWFQADQACALSGKRLVRNDEWQRAAAGTPDPGTDNGTSDCNISFKGIPVNTGSRANCKSSWGIFDMVGNVDEWVADWSGFAANCTDWTSETGLPGGDYSCFAGPSNFGIPAALYRGGGSTASTRAGVFAVFGEATPMISLDDIGFRCAR